MPFSSRTSTNETNLAGYLLVSYVQFKNKYPLSHAYKKAGFLPTLIVCMTALVESAQL